MIVISAAKTMNESFEQKMDHCHKVDALVKQINSYTKPELGLKMKIKNKTLDATFEYYNSFGSTQQKALNLYNGLVFKQLSCTNETYVQEHVFILSALYGLINGADNISPYRLDFTMNKLLNLNLYDYWQEEVVAKINANSDKQLLNLASNEYFKLVDLEKVTKEIFTIQPVGKLNSTQLKKLRGQLLNFCIEQSITDYNQLRDFNSELFRVTDITSDNKIIIEEEDEFKENTDKLSRVIPA